MRIKLIYKIVIMLIITVILSSCNQEKTANFPCDQKWEGGGKNNQIGYSPDGSTIGIISEKCVFFVDAKSLNPRFSFPSNYEIQSFAYASNMDFIAMLSDHGDIYLVDSQNGNILQSWHDDDAFNLIELSPDNNYLITNSFDGFLSAWNINTLQKEYIFDSRKYNTALVSIAFSTNGDLIAAGTNFGKVFIWNVHSGNLINTIEAHEGWVGKLLFTNDGSKLITYSDDAFIKIWNAYSGNLLNTINAFEYWGGRTDLALINRNSDLVFLNGDNQIGYVNLNNPGIYKVIEEFENKPAGFSISPNEKSIAVDFMFGKIIVVDR